METYLLSAKWKKITGFKSYYVVWKPFRFSSCFFCVASFKSYYVVWKLFVILLI